jgi:hypothetical protein
MSSNFIMKEDFKHQNGASPVGKRGRMPEMGPPMDPGKGSFTPSPVQNAAARPRYLSTPRGIGRFTAGIAIRNTDRRFGKTMSRDFFPAFIFL